MKANGIWVYVEVNEHGVLRTSLELLGKAAELKARAGEPCQVVAVLLGGEDDPAMSGELWAWGADVVLEGRSGALDRYSPRPFAAALSRLCEIYRPSILLIPATDLGHELAPRVMAKLRTGLTADAIDVFFDQDGSFVQVTPAFGGKVLAHIAIPEKRPQMVTIREHTFPLGKPAEGRQGERMVESLAVEPDPDYTILEESEAPESGAGLRQARVIVSCGRGIKSREDLDQIRILAGLMNAALACSRPLADEGWLERERQIGQSGCSVEPEHILNIGISGSVQYAAGIRGAGTVACLNHDGNAPLMTMSHLGIVGDYRALVPALIREFAERKGIKEHE